MDTCPHIDITWNIDIIKLYAKIAKIAKIGKCWFSVCCATFVLARISQEYGRNRIQQDARGLCLGFFMLVEVCCMNVARD